ncbi:MAG: plasmid mobilization relaxosome protein MobC [Flavobacteriaceae bacterium]|nr:plasmid mobilization relaxosome protein MobC [Flavobacteriaceae bacterium]
MKKKKKTIGGRKKLPDHLKRKQFDLYLNDEELKILKDQQEMIGFKGLRSYMRYKLLKDKKRMIYVNPVELLKQMDFYGAEMGRIGSNINQMSRHANQLSKVDGVDVDVIEAFTKAIEEYNNLRSKIFMCFNKIMSNT